MSQRIKYWVVDHRETRITLDGKSGDMNGVRFPFEAIMFSVVLGPDDVFDPPPPVRRGIEEFGWRVMQKELPPSGLNDEGLVDWRAVAHGLASAMQALLDEEVDGDQTATDTASSALDDFRIAEHEESMRVIGEPLPPEEKKGRRFDDD